VTDGEESGDRVGESTRGSCTGNSRVLGGREST
jgi:hypothetical protein